ncbi:curli production assembly/transport protein CsgE [Shewanella olleyana]|uniref:curli production assembly/transport protein CsgE n=1 Tax=Shewanella olleyana TaxID=135626 RepID=UPI00200E9FCF|nr:curli production assembly/transport protein CsgE [Shewanella olleyana]MCL1068196.1 curli production assembly/transport protein CsgE [Shewanella olleyana]
MRNINLMFFILLLTSNANAGVQPVTDKKVAKPVIEQSSNKNEATVDQNLAEIQSNAKEPEKSATDKSIQNATKVKPIDISDAVPAKEKDLIDGLILNRAMTRLGHRFYREFVSSYRDIGGDTKHSGITVIEQATARSGSKILIQQNRKTIFVTFVSPMSRNIDDQAEYAAKRVNSTVKKVNERALLGSFFDPDLAPDEI